MILKVFWRTWKKLNQEIEHYLDFIKDQDESILEKNFNKRMQTYFASIIQDVGWSSNFETS